MTRAEIDWLDRTVHVKDHALGNVNRGTFSDSFWKNLSPYPHPLLSKVLWSRINSCYSKLFSNLKQKYHIIICTKLISSHMGPMNTETSFNLRIRSSFRLLYFFFIWLVYFSQGKSTGAAEYSNFFLIEVNPLNRQWVSRILHKTICSPVGQSCRILELHHDDTKPSDGDALELELWETWSNHS